MKPFLTNGLKYLFEKMGCELSAKSNPKLTIEHFIRHAFPRGEEVKFMQVGAHDAGSANDPIKRFRQENTWSGTLVEANPAIFPKLSANLKPYPRCNAVNMAVADIEGEMSFYTVKDSSKTKHPTWADQISSLDKNHVLGVLKSWEHSPGEIESLLKVITVPTITFESLLSREKIDRLDFLFIDAEGYDFKLLSSFPFARFRPTLLIFEHSHLNASELRVLPDFLSSNGYFYYTVGEDVVARKRS